MFDGTKGVCDEAEDPFKYMVADVCDEPWFGEPGLLVYSVLWVATELTKVGFVRSANIIASVESIKLNVDSDARASVQNSPTWMHLKTCSWSLQVLFITGSITSSIFPLWYSPHAYMTTTYLHIEKIYRGPVKSAISLCWITEVNRYGLLSLGQ